MRYIIDISDNKRAFAEELFKNMSFIKQVRSVESNEITNPTILRSIEEYESRKTIPTPMSLSELKQMLNA